MMPKQLLTMLHHNHYESLSLNVGRDATWTASEHGEVDLDFLSTEGLQQGGTLIGPQGHSLPLGLGLTVRAISAARLGKTTPHGLHQLLKAGVHLLRVHAVHHLRVHAALHLQTEIRQG